MAFQSLQAYNEQRYGGMFLLKDDGDFADVVFLYRSVDDVLVADTHYIKSADYSGYVHCCGRGCPACAKNIRVQSKLFIPLYVIEDDEIRFWDRTMRFEPQLSNDVFRHYPNPSEFVFRITRHGKSGDINTTYDISVVGKNTVKSYDEILAGSNAVFPNYYEKVCRDVPAVELKTMLNPAPEDAAGNNEGYVSPYAASIPDYQIKPRVTAKPAEVHVVPSSTISVPEAEADVGDIPFDDGDVIF